MTGTVWETVLVALVPLYIVVGVGVLLNRNFPSLLKTLTTVTVYVFLPALVFSSILTTPIPGAGVLRIFVGVAAYTIIMYLLLAAISVVQGATRADTTAILMGGTFTNVGTLGIPVAAVLYGPLGRDVAVMFLVSQNLIMYSLGAFTAAAGTQRQFAARDALRNVFRLPLLYAVGAALLLRALAVSGENPLLHATSIAGNAAVPLMLLILGVQLGQIDHGISIQRVGSATVAKSLIAPIVGVVVAILMGFSAPELRDTFILGTATPTAVVPLVLSIEYEGDRRHVSSQLSEIIFLTTLVSPVVLVGVLVTVHLW